MRTLLVVLVAYACNVESKPRVQVKSGVWSWDLVQGKTQTLAAGTFRLPATIGGDDCAGDDSCDSSFTKDLAVTVGGLAAGSDAAFEIHGGGYIPGGAGRRVFIRLWPGCCAPDGKGYAPFVATGYIHNSDSLDGVVYGSGADNAIFSATWKSEK